MSTASHPAPSQVTQAQHPWRSSVRSMVQFTIGLAAIWGVVVELAGVDPAGKLVAPTILAAGAVTRIMGNAQVERLLRSNRLTSWLAAAPPASQ